MSTEYLAKIHMDAAIKDREEVYLASSQPQVRRIYRLLRGILGHYRNPNFHGHRVEDSASMEADVQRIAEFMKPVDKQVFKQMYGADYREELSEEHIVTATAAFVRYRLGLTNVDGQVDDMDQIILPTLLEIVSPDFPTTPQAIKGKAISLVQKYTAKTVLFDSTMEKEKLVGLPRLRELADIWAASQKPRINID